MTDNITSQSPGWRFIFDVCGAFRESPRRVIGRKWVDSIQVSWRGVERTGSRLELLHREVDEGAKAR